MEPSLRGFSTSHTFGLHHCLYQTVLTPRLNLNHPRSVFIECCYCLMAAPSGFMTASRFCFLPRRKVQILLSDPRYLDAGLARGGVSGAGDWWCLVWSATPRDKAPASVSQETTAPSTLQHSAGDWWCLVWSATPRDRAPASVSQWEAAVSSTVGCTSPRLLV